MPVLLLSGGLDSSAIAYDVAQHPHRYGVELTGQPLHLLTYTYEPPATKKKHLKPLLDKLAEVSRFTSIEHHVVMCPLTERPRKKTRSWQTIDPLGDDFRREMMPYTPGLHLWLAAQAINLVELHGVDDGPYTSPQVMFGFQFDGPAWVKLDNDDLLPTDTSPAFIEKLNELAEVSGHQVWFRAPFLDQRMNKDMIAALAIEAGVPLEHTSSCVEGWKVDCGLCGQCMHRSAVLKGVGR